MAKDLNRPRPARMPRQVAAICLRSDHGQRQVLLISSRDTGRWVLPKGWQGRRLSPFRAALREAWEEAGVRAARVAPRPIGCYLALKRRSDGPDLRCRTVVFLVEVQSLSESFPEAGQRRRVWMRPGEAARAVAEPGLKALLRRL